MENQFKPSDLASSYLAHLSHYDTNPNDITSDTIREYPAPLVAIYDALVAYDDAINTNSPSVKEKLAAVHDAHEAFLFAK